ncbi:hypothetical protein I656_02984 [Geobacillus sp. WSUCF1]|nr:hypothetical protein I656_02984 [Geobacillus sp. WSUCF1]
MLEYVGEYFDNVFPLATEAPCGFSRNHGTSHAKSCALSTMVQNDAVCIALFFRV